MLFEFCLEIVTLAIEYFYFCRLKIYSQPHPGEIALFLTMSRYLLWPESADKVAVQGFFHKLAVNK
ncbi:MAG: hypothetical protein CMQ21_05655 [Gammaproteobacteria bacterium]|nr:hypothetical protein [Gammaproteobacteria bacterium]